MKQDPNQESGQATRSAIALVPFGFIITFGSVLVAAISSRSSGDTYLALTFRATEYGLLAALLLPVVWGLLFRRPAKSMLANAASCLAGSLFAAATIVVNAGGAVSDIRAEADWVANIPPAVFARLDLNHDGILTLSEISQTTSAEATSNLNKEILQVAVAKLKEMKLEKDSSEQKNIDKAIGELEGTGQSIAQKAPSLSDQESDYAWRLKEKIPEVCGSAAAVAEKPDPATGCSLNQLRSYPDIVRAKFGRYYWLADVSDRLFKPHRKS